MKKTIEFRWDLLERIKRNSEDWELNEVKDLGIKLKCDCVKSFMDTRYVSNVSTFPNTFALVLDSNLHDLSGTNPD